MERVNRFKSLDSVITDGNMTSEEINERIKKDNRCYWVLQSLMKSKENLERQETNKNRRGTERHLPKTDDSVVRPAGERRQDI